MTTSISTQTIVEKLVAEHCTVSPAFDLAKAKVEAKEGSDQTWVHFLPFGTFYRQIWADEVKVIDVNDAIAASLVDEFKKNGAGRRHIDVNHLSLFGFDYEAGKAYGWMVDAKIEGKAGDGNAESGVWVLVDWTEAGTKARRSREYQLFSPTWYTKGSFDIKKGVVDPTPKIHSGALTNTPFFEHYLAAVAAASKAANPNPNPPATAEEDQMADPKDPKNPIETPALEAASKLTDKERQELDELRADKKVASIAEAARQKQERDAVFEKHSKRLSPATMAALRGDLEKLEAAKIDAYLSRLSDEVHPTPTGTSAAPAGDPAKAKKEDPEGELLERATKLRKENPELRLDQRGAINRIKRDDPELAARVQKQRESYKIPILSPEA